MDQNVTWFGGKPRPRRRCVRWGPSPRPQKGGGTLSLIVGPFLLWLNGCMHQDAIWYEGRPQPRDFVLDGNPAPSPKREPPIFGGCLLRPNGCMDQDATWYGGRPQPRRHCVRWGPSFPSPTGAGAPFSNFWPMSIVAKRPDGSKCHLVRR